MLAALTAAAQATNPARLKIRGVGLDSTYAQVVRALGKPIKESRPEKEECIGGREKTVQYPGLEIYFMDGDSPGGKTFEVKSFDVTSGAWSVSGIKIGDAEATVKTRLGRRFTIDNDPATGETTWHYDMGDRAGPGTTHIHFKNGKVVRIGTGFQVC